MTDPVTTASNAGIKTTEGWATLITVILSAIAIAVNMRSGEEVIKVDNETLAVISGSVVCLYTICRTCIKVFVGR